MSEISKIRSNCDQAVWKAFYAQLSCLIVALLAWHGVLNIFGDTPELWFQRSGSIIVVIAALSEYYLFDIKSAFPKEAYAVPYALKEWEKDRLRYIEYSGFILMAAGTLVWGYGDLLYCWVTQ